MEIADPIKLTIIWILSVGPIVLATLPLLWYWPIRYLVKFVCEFEPPDFGFKFMRLIALALGGEAPDIYNPEDSKYFTPSSQKSYVPSRHKPYVFRAKAGGLPQWHVYRYGTTGTGGERIGCNDIWLRGFVVPYVFGFVSVIVFDISIGNYGLDAGWSLLMKFLMFVGMMLCLRYFCRLVKLIGKVAAVAHSHDEHFGSITPVDFKMPSFRK